MSRLIQVALPSGQVIWANVAEGPSDVGGMDALRKISLDDLRDTVEGVAQTVAGAVERIAPDQVGVEFGLELSLKTGKLTSVLAEASGKASIKLTLSWSGDKSPALAGDGDDNGNDDTGD
ncbi:hypothetical protein JIG36_11855 [Actinoplanes sp. LDG1-06]|uniref:Trypsin-co-occurring domain-containing protein n=1 Tax=Paractinoplanes ovalisporus TaxID=2810368 RepID=A0ABS2A8T2_9ACTN|nr:CU044_2847 family protein [Actinoplanes ovalisporus]MBM2616252.1 hypothetical protein [Actinoplanes ovalisporus]